MRYKDFIALMSEVSSASYLIVHGLLAVAAVIMLFLKMV